MNKSRIVSSLWVVTGIYFLFNFFRERERDNGGSCPKTLRLVSHYLHTINYTNKSKSYKLFHSQCKVHLLIFTIFPTITTRTSSRFRHASFVLEDL
ncbi:hypothetical protein GYMLUDRAFT_277873 [Collybiopsis luxurians FD-317 M1]|nr:hypothetical protein GYMLUDRAFT_277873 [Collybiopsis luxurians FD-317 M1]